MTNNNSNNRRPKPANNNRAPNRPSNYEFLPYAGTGTEVVDDLQSGAAPSWRLLAVAAWHDAKFTGRNRVIADRLRAVAGQQDMQVAA
ncbi:hypothetical protein [Rhizobium sp. 768_B6_N1_8]|uniref:hypothetical protein n=1 Tax=unclassified Rhizobium TaxID=2613769 RepID=UPI003F20825A